MGDTYLIKNTPNHFPTFQKKNFGLASFLSKSMRVWCGQTHEHPYVQIQQYPYMRIFFQLSSKEIKSMLRACLDVVYFDQEDYAQFDKFDIICQIDSLSSLEIFKYIFKFSILSWCETYSICVTSQTTKRMFLLHVLFVSLLGSPLCRYALL